MTWFIGLFDTTCDWSSDYIVTTSLPLLGSGLKPCTFPFLWVPKLSPASATSFWEQLKPSGNVTVTLRPTVSRPVRLGVRRPSRTRDHIFFLFEIFFRQLRVCYFVAPSLTRGRVCNLLLLLVLASAVPLGSESRGTQGHILLFQLLSLPQSGGLGPRIYITQEQGGPDKPPGTGFPYTAMKLMHL
jgi:hypothetical protein